MDEFKNYLSRPALDTLFSPGEMSELLISVYNYARAAVRDDCDRITVDARSVKWSGAGRAHESAIGIDMREQFVQVLQRDQVMAAHLVLLETSPHHTTYRIIRH